MGLLDAFRKQRVAQLQSKADQYKEIRDILLRRNQPKPKDGERLAGLCDDLGISENVVKFWMAVLDAATEFENEIAQGKAAEAELQRLADAAGPIEKQIGELRARLEELLEPHRIQSLRSQVMTQHTRDADFSNLKRAIPWLVADDFVSQPKGQVNESGGLRALKDSLGIKREDGYGWMPPAADVAESAV